MVYLGLSEVFFLPLFVTNLIKVTLGWGWIYEPLSYYLRAAFRLAKAWLILHNQFGENGNDVICFYFVGVHH